MDPSLPRRHVGGGSPEVSPWIAVSVALFALSARASSVRAHLSTSSTAQAAVVVQPFQQEDQARPRSPGRAPHRLQHRPRQGGRRQGVRDQARPRVASSRREGHQGQGAATARIAARRGRGELTEAAKTSRSLKRRSASDYGDIVAMRELPGGRTGEDAICVRVSSKLRRRHQARARSRRRSTRSASASTSAASPSRRSIEKDDEIIVELPGLDDQNDRRRSRTHRAAPPSSSSRSSTTARRT